MAEVRAVLPNVRAPALILHADHDPVASPASAGQLAAAIASDDRHVHAVASTSHGILRGESAPLVHEQIAGFIQGLVDHWD